MSIPRAEYPRPQFARDRWLCLNGTWQFEMDKSDSGLERGLVDASLASEITVPFCPESELSGIGDTDFLNAVWYRREVEIPADWTDSRILLNFQAVDYDATVWANGTEVGRHRGGWAGFTCDLDDIAKAGQTITIVVRARDDHRQQKPQGKQSPKFGNHGCLYTRTTGIWQTVWLEPVPVEARLDRPRITPELGQSRFLVEAPVIGRKLDKAVKVTLSDEQGEVAVAEVGAGETAALDIPDDRARLWSTTDPHLYDLEIELLDAEGNVLDAASSYAGLRDVQIDGMAVRINGEAVFQRLVLDQGYYPDGIMTAPTDEALKRDIELSIAAGFNGARLHQKVFEERFLYHADCLGYLCWGEYGDWFGDRNFRSGSPYATPIVVREWIDCVQRDYSHPSIIGWCPMNETLDRIKDQPGLHDDLVTTLYWTTKALDRTRPVLDTSGYSHRVPESDIYDCHDYCQDPVELADRYATLGDEPGWKNEGSTIESIPHAGQPYFVSEFGGIWWNPAAKEGEASWGYGQRPSSLDEFYSRFDGLCTVLLKHPRMFGYCYTQLTDVFQEQNGIYGFDRSVKFDMKRIRKVQTQPAAIEEADAVDV